MLERCHKESFKTGAEISAIKELKIFLVQQEKNITLAADRDDSRGLDTYLYRIRKTWKERLVSMLLVQIFRCRIHFKSWCQLLELLFLATVYLTYWPKIINCIINWLSLYQKNGFICEDFLVLGLLLQTQTHIIFVNNTVFINASPFLNT